MPDIFLNTRQTPAPATPGGALADGFGRVHRYLRISLTERCNLRCRYCMPPEGVDLSEPGQILNFDEIERLAALAVSMGVEKIRLTGGEPLVRRGVTELAGRLTAIPGLKTLAMTTNGVALTALAAPLRAAGLTTVNISLDTLRPDRFERIALRPGFGRVIDGIDAALSAGFAPVKINMVVIGGVNDDELCDMIEFAQTRPVHVRFIEYMPFEGNQWSRGALIPWRAMLERITKRFELRPVLVPGEHQTARVFNAPEVAGSIGFIAPMTDSFCTGCDRIRLTADGRLKPCLHDGFEVNLREPMRTGASGAELAALMRGAVARKAAAHAPADELARTPNRSMVRIGG